MATLQVKNVDDKLYRRLKANAAAEHRSLSQQVLAIIEEHLKQAANPPIPRPITDFIGAWKNDERSTEEIIRDTRASRRTGHRFKVKF